MGAAMRELFVAGCMLLIAACSPPHPQPPRAAANPAPPAAGPPRMPAGINYDPAELLVDANAEPVSGYSPLTVHFTATIDDAARLQFTWAFGDGSTAGTAADTFHVYSAPGDYTATVTVRDRQGHIGSDEVEVLVLSPGEGSGSAGSEQ